MLLRRPARALLAAVTFLTVIPLARRVALDGADVARGAVLFPVVGAGIGAVVGGIAWVLGLHGPPLLAAALGVAVGCGLTGALHLDGLADYADGYGGRTVEDRLRIMRDHTIGTYGAAAVMLDLLLKASALAAVAGSSHALAVAVAASAIGRISGPLLALRMPYAQRVPGAGAVLMDAGPGRAIATVLIGAALAAAAVGAIAAAAAVAALLVIAAMRRSCRARLGGVTGDAMGSAAELAEVAALCMLVVLL